MADRTTPKPASAATGPTGGSSDVVTVDTVRSMLRGVMDPELGSNIVELGMVRDVAVDGGEVTVTIALTTSGCPLRAQIQKDIRTRVGSMPGVDHVSLAWDEMTKDEKATAMERARFNIAQRTEQSSVAPHTKVILVSSGKGGVGKSSVTVNLAAAMAAMGRRVGVLDADIWGFSVPRLLGVSGRLSSKQIRDKKYMVPNERVVGDGLLRVISMGFLVDDEESALMWRGLMLNRGVQHFLQDVEWGDDLDYLLVDMPPGTGDVQMGVAKLIPRAEVLVVTTPAVNAQKVASRAVSMSRKNFLRVAGVVENMSAFVCDHGQRYELFGAGGGAALAADAGVPLLGQIPMEPAVSVEGDTGEPVAFGDSPAGQAFRDLAEVILTEAVPMADMAGCSARMLDAAMERLDALEL